MRGETGKVEGSGNRDATAAARADGGHARALAGAALDAALVDARRRTQAILADLAQCHSTLAAGWKVPLRSDINPPLWEYGHLAWFAEWWVLRDPCPEPGGPGHDDAPWIATRPSMLPDADRWFDSARVAHDTRWHLELPSHAALHDYAQRVLDGVRARLAALGPDAHDAALEPFRLVLFHEDMHAEALTYLRQTLDYPPPRGTATTLGTVPDEVPLLDCGGGPFVVGFVGDDGFAFDNEVPPRGLTVAPFRIGRDVTDNATMRAFVEAGGYRDARLWSPEGRAWLDRRGRGHPARWRRSPSSQSRWEHRWFGRWDPLPLDRPAVHVNAFEAEACAAWLGRRLPHEAEWEWAAIHASAFRWGHAVWEWTADAFLPYPGFRAGRYREYSAPWFATHRSVRGASFATHGRMRHPRYRNFYTPERDDLFVGFRTCAADRS